MNEFFLYEQILQKLNKKEVLMNEINPIRKLGALIVTPQKNFVAKQSFRIGPGIFSGYSPKFHDLFMGITEENNDQEIIYFGELENSTCSTKILVGQVSLAVIYQLLIDHTKVFSVEKNKNHIFFVKDIHGSTKMVSVSFYRGGWFLSADFIGRDFLCSKGTIVFYKKADDTNICSGSIGRQLMVA